MSFASQTRQSLSQWITFLLPAVPIRSRATFIELLCACLISPEGWVTRAISAICREKHWTTYYKLSERGNVRLVPPFAHPVFLDSASITSPIDSFRPGFNNLWQQTRTALELWMQVRSTAWTLAHLVALTVEASFPIQAIAPWRIKHPLTAGLIAQWLRVEFTGLRFRSGFDKKSQILCFPDERVDPRLRKKTLTYRAGVNF